MNKYAQFSKTPTAGKRAPVLECSSKVRYETPLIADQVRERCEAERGKPLRIYQCHLCAGWHLTKARPLAPATTRQP